MKGKIVGEGKKRKYYLDGEEVTKARFDRAFPPKEEDGDDLNISTSWKKPIHSEALSVHPRLRAQAMEIAAKRGVPTEFDKKGRPVFTSRKHRRDYLRIRTMRDSSGNESRCHDNDGGYGD